MKDNKLAKQTKSRTQRYNREFGKRGVEVPFHAMQRKHSKVGRRVAN